MIMTSPSIPCAGLVGRVNLTLDCLLELATVDANGCPVVSFLDVLAVIHLHADADVLLLELASGELFALTVREVVSSDDSELQLVVGGGGHVPRLRSSRRALPEQHVVAITAVSFAHFVGRTW
jgi:hypothetical protein